MDLDEWELLPKNGFKDLDLEQDDDHHEAIMMDYFLCPSTQDSIVVPTKLLQVPIALEPLLDHENKKRPNDLDLDPTVSFKKMKETEFADMKIDPPVMIMSPMAQIDDVKPYDLEGGGDLHEKKEINHVINDCGGEKLNLWKIGLNGVGAICSFGVAAAAASVCVLFLGHNNIKVCKNKNKNQMLRFQIYSDDKKSMKEVVNHATKLNDAIFGMKGVLVVRAQISFGGFYDHGH